METTTGEVKMKRLESLDALRGFDMLWIIGGEAVILALAKYFYPNLNWLSTQMHHVAWGGFRFYDLIFALFVFIAGVSMAFSMEKHHRSGESDNRLLFHLVKRCILLVLLGLIYNGLLDFNVAKQRWCSVLGLIGITTFMASLVALKWRSMRSLLIAAATLWIIIFVMQKFVTIDGLGGGNFAQGHNINAVYDQWLLGKFDPEGPFNILSAVFLPLIGCAVGRLLILRHEYDQRWTNVAILAGAGAVFIGAAYLLGFCGDIPYYPVIKKAWTGSFNLLTAGIALIAFAVFHAVIDLLDFKKWAFPFKVIGMNAITIYLAYRFFDFAKPSRMIFGGLGDLTGDFRPVIIALGIVIIEWLILWLFYRKKIFLKV